MPPPSPPRKESELLIALEHSRLVHAVMKRASPEWWLGHRFAQVQTEEDASEITCVLFHDLEGLAKTRGFELIVLVQLEEGETLSESIRAESVLSCLSDPSTRVIDLKPALSEMKAKDLTRYNRMYVWRFTEGHIIPGHMSAEGNHFVSLEILKVLTQSLPAALRLQLATG